MLNLPKAKNNSYIAYMLMFTLFGAFTLVHAKENEYNSNNRDTKMYREEKMPLLRDKRPEDSEKRMENRCRLRETLVGNRLNMYSRSHKFHVAVYIKLRDRVDNLITRLKEKGADTAKLEADLAVLREKIATVEEKYQALIDELQKIKDIPCDELEDDDVKPSLDAAKKALEELKAATKDVREYFSNTIKPDLAEIKEQLREMQDEADSSN